MDSYLQFIESLGNMKVQLLPSGTCNGRMQPSVDNDASDDDEVAPMGTSYCKEYQFAEFAKYEDAMYTQPKICPMSMVSGITDLPQYGDANLDFDSRVETSNRIYKDYVFIAPTRAPLPIDSKRLEILRMLQVTNVVIIHGATGCGKTTQVPQFILDEYRERQEYCNIVVTQPRKLAAISVAKHVSEDRGWEMGSIIGYQVGLDRQTGPDTILTYMTAGVLLQKIILRKDLNEFTHIIIDEVHERTQEMDFLLIILRRFLNTNSLNVKIILMSATFDTEKFANYFKNVTAGIDIPAPSIDVNKPMMFDKSIHYIEELTYLGDIDQDYDFSEVSIPANIFHVFVQLVLALKHVDTDEDTIGHVLVFLPGIHEIEVAYNLLMAESSNGKANFMIVPLHSSIPGHEQRRVFAKPGPGVRKIILSTNIAESSITVPDIVYVIDFCMTKTLVVHTMTQYHTLQLSWASKTNCIQRAGRVGRVCSGRVYRLVTRDFYENMMSADIPPEMLRAPLERVVLFSKKLEIDELPQSILALALDPPDLSNIVATIKNLKEAGALLPTCRGTVVETDGDITMLGTLMWNLPLDVKLSKLICLGYMFSCLEESIIMAAGCSLPNIFATPFKDRLSAYVNKLLWADASCSDLIAYLKLYQTYQNNKANGSLRNIQDEKKWCALNYLSYRSMRDWEELVKELKARLESMNIRPPIGPQHIVIKDSEKVLLMKTIIAGAFYPNYFSRSCDAGQVDEKEVCKTIHSLDRNSTVYFTNMALNQPGPLYEQRIKDIMKPISDDVDVYFDQRSKVFVTFKDKRKPASMNVDGRRIVAMVPGKIHMDVYKAVRMRQLRFNTSFPIMQSKDAWDLAIKLNLATNTNGCLNLIEQPVKKQESRVVPGLTKKKIIIRVTHCIDAGHFYAQSSNQTCQDNLDMILQCLNIGPLDLVDKDLIEVGGLYAAKYDGLFYRCSVLNIIPFATNETRINIMFVDYGNTERIAPNELFHLPDGPAKTLAPQAMECVLCGVQPVVTFNRYGTWSDKANSFFRSQTTDVDLRAIVYSAVKDIVSMEVFSPSEPKTINQMLIELEYGEKYEEPFLSRENHELRENVRKNLSDLNVDDECSLMSALPVSAAVHVPAPAAKNCWNSVELRGPFSPLEMKVYSMNITKGDVRIDGNSINGVLLDHAPQDPHERLLVATNISKSQRSETLSLRLTTMMTNIRGLPAIIPLIFAPKVVIKASYYGTSYASVLCGLGVNERNKPVYPEHDLNVVFDVEFTDEDLVMINEIRFIMNRLIDSMQSAMTKKIFEPHQHHRQLKDRLMQLLMKARESKEREFVKYAESWTKNEFNGIKIAPDAGYRKSWDIWPLHDAVELIDKNDRNVMTQQHIDELSSYTRRYKDMPDFVYCKFCQVDIVTLVGLRGHVITPKHKQNIERYRNQSAQTSEY